MVAFLIRRLVFIAMLVMGTTTLIFAAFHVAPSDPAGAALGPYASPEAVEAYRQERGLNEPILTQYVIYFQRLLVGDFGTSILSGRPVLDEFARALPATVELMIPSLILSTTAGIALGVIGGVRRGRWPDSLSRVLAVFGMSMPVFWFGLVLQIVFYLWLGWLPVGRRLGAAEIAPPTVTGLLTIDSLLVGDLALFFSALRHLVLPMIALSLVNLAEMARMTRSALLEVLNQEYIRVAHSKGLSSGTVVRRHALRNALIPIVTVLGIQVGRALGGAIIVETIFTWPGIGRQVVDALLKLDLPMVAAYGILVSLGYGFANLLVDLSYLLIDPRIRHQRGTG